jgi:hypothetical protein
MNDVLLGQPLQSIVNNSVIDRIWSAGKGFQSEHASASWAQWDLQLQHIIGASREPNWRI